MAEGPHQAVKWFGAEWPVSIRTLASRMKAHPFTEERSNGFFIDRITAVLFALHLLQILLWAGFYRWLCFPAWGESLYFSPSSFSTVGYGDIVLPRMWRILGPLESVTGVLMCGLSVRPMRRAGSEFNDDFSAKR
jgi:Ion channel